MAKGRGGRGREEKKPKADKKPATAASTFLRPQARRQGRGERSQEIAVDAGGFLGLLAQRLARGNSRGLRRLRSRID